MRSLVVQFAVLIGIIGGGWLLYNRGDVESDAQKFAVQGYSWIIGTGVLSPKFLATVYRYRGDAYAALGDRRHAIEDYAASVELDPNAAKSYFSRAAFYRAIGQHKRAVADYSAAIEINPGYGEAFLHRAFSYTDLGEANLARQDYEKARQLKVDVPFDKDKFPANAQQR